MIRFLPPFEVLEGQHEKLLCQITPKSLQTCKNIQRRLFRRVPTRAQACVPRVWLKCDPDDACGEKLKSRCLPASPILHCPHFAHVLIHPVFLPYKMMDFLNLFNSISSIVSPIFLSNYQLYFSGFFGTKCAGKSCCQHLDCPHFGRALKTKEQHTHRELKLKFMLIGQGHWSP